MIFIIAEIGINHNGDLDIAKELIKIASKSGCDAVKFQKRDIESVYAPEMLDSPRKSPWGTTQREQKMGLEFGHEEYSEIDRYCRELEIEWFASAWDTKSIDFLSQFDLKYDKVASAMIVNNELLNKVATQNRHTFISTGMSTESGIKNAIEIFKKHNCSFELMHTISIYPMEDADANLKRIYTLREKFKCDVGYSGHEVGLAISYAAAALGISSLERHITLDRSMYGSDQSASIEPAGLTMLVGAVRKIEMALGDGNIKMNQKELPIAKKLREHIDWESGE